MNILLCLALATTTVTTEDISLSEIETGFRVVREKSLEPISDEKIASEAARYLSLTDELSEADGKGSPPLVTNLPMLMAYFKSLRAKTAGRVDERRLVEQLVLGMIDATGHNGDYFDIEAQKAMALAGPAGVGLSAKRESGFPVVVSTLAKSTANGALLAGDVVTHINSESTKGLALGAFVRQLRGKIGSRVTLTVVRGTAPPREIILVREILVQPPSATWRLEGSVGIIKISRFEPSTTEEVIDAIKSIRHQSKNLTGYLMDLRGNQGGRLEVLVDLADLFMDNGPIGGLRGRLQGDVERYSARRGDVTRGSPLVIVTDGKTASGAEMLAAALQASRRARVVGQRTLGNCYIQTLINLSERSAVTLTTSQYFAGDESSICGTGVTPDIETPVASPEKDETLTAALALFANVPTDQSRLRSH